MATYLLARSKKKRDALMRQAVFLLGLLLIGGAHAGTVYYDYTDPEGNVLAVADVQGNVVARYDYAPYGEPVASLGSPPDGPGYTGHVNDPETGLVYMQARYYLPVGRFPSPDPVGPSAGNLFSFNRYTYADNNPITNVDPSGRESACVSVNNCLNNPGSEALSSQVGQVFYGAALAVSNEWGRVFHGGSGEWQTIRPTNNAQQLGMLAGAAAIAAAETEVMKDASAEADSSDIPPKLYHYTSEAGMKGILESETLNPSLKALNPNDVRYGNGQYLSDIAPGTMTPAQLSRAFINNPFQGARYTNFIEINTANLNVIQGRPGVYVIPNEVPLDLSGRITNSGQVPGQ
jgi:RHS repeat-associated protein